MKNNVEALRKEELKKKITHLSTLLEVSAGYPQWFEYAHEQDRTIDELLKIIRNEPKPKQSFRTKLILWQINNLKKLL
jgi:hypothetical protein